MVLKISIELVKEMFELKGWELLSDRYVSNRDKLEFRCGNGHTHQIAWDSFQRGTGCGQCNGTPVKTLEQLRKSFESAGYTLLEKNYKGKDAPLAFQCDKGHIRSMSWGSFRSGRRCAECSRNVRKTIEDVRESFSEIGWTLLSTEYNNAQEKLDFKCSNGHIHSISWGKFQYGHRCVYCSGLNTPDIKDIQKLFTAKGWTLITDKYINTKQKLEFKCNEGHIHTISMNSFYQGVGCGECTKTGFDMNKPGTLYYIQFTHKGQNYYKIGITNRTIDQRFKGELGNATVGFIKTFLFGSLAIEEEQKILKKYKKYRYKGEPFLKYGNTELFTKDVLKIF